MKKLFSVFIAVFAVIALIFGFISEDPFGSKTQVSDKTPIINNPINVSYGTPIYTDNFDGANDTTALKTRGYLVFYRGTGPQGSTATWFQGNETVFPSYNGPNTGYVAANYNAVTGVNNIDSWLVLPKVSGGLIAGDSLYFYSRAPLNSTYPDSITVSYSVSDSVPEGTWTTLGKFKVNTAGAWQKTGFRAPTAGANARFAIRYKVVAGGPSGSNSDYIGVDALTIERTGGGPTQTFYSSAWCSGGTLPNLPAATYFQAAEWLGDTLYVHAPSTTGTQSTTIYRYKLGGSWSTGVPCLTAVTGASLTKCNGKLYLIGGGVTSVTTGSNNVQEYNPATGTWTAKAPMPAALSAHGSVCWGDSVIFVVGGPYTGSATNLAVHYYRPASDTWGTIASSLPSGQGRRSHSLAISGNKIFMAAGYNTTFLKSFYIGTIGSNASSLTWAAGPDVPTPWTGISRVGGTAYGPLFFVVGGERGGVGGYSDTTFVFNSQWNVWQQTIDNKPNAMSNMWAGVAGKVFNDTFKVFVPGGYTGAASNSFDYLGCGPTLTGNGNNFTTVPVNYDLSQNYPNPFNPVTKISYSLPKADLVTLKVYDITGREIMTLVNEVKQTGKYTVDFNGTNLSSGVYFYKLTAGDFSSVKRMMLIK